MSDDLHNAGGSFLALSGIVDAILLTLATSSSSTVVNACRLTRSCTIAVHLKSLLFNMYE